jgi:hypothetical protein
LRCQETQSKPLTFSHAKLNMVKCFLTRYTVCILGRVRGMQRPLPLTRNAVMRKLSAECRCMTRVRFWASVRNVTLVASGPSDARNVAPGDKLNGLRYTECNTLGQCRAGTRNVVPGTLHYQSWVPHNTECSCGAGTRKIVRGVCKVAYTRSLC